MRKIAMLGILAAAGTIVPALAQTPNNDVKFPHITAPATGAEGLPDLAPGDDVAIACEPIERVADPSDVRVVLTIAAAPGDSSPGYKKILALDEKLTGSAVHLKVPDAPDLPNHTVNLSVYVVDKAQSNDCDAGQYRIVDSPAVPAPKSPG
ncbi:MAG: hypothetical protein JO261_15890 [Alphaproteobacteria bacterium]|nr:hypothetical protein [Alphaproteobacteria bacterium]MBV9695175.1 hypothetical protein [Alphaproteobacteria bacterium]